MSKYNLEQCINNLVKDLQHNYVNLMLEFDEEAIHQFRVNYKKLRALYQLPIFDKHNHFQFNKNIKHFYNLLGHLRDQHILYTNLIDNLKLPLFNLFWFIHKLNGKSVQIKYLILFIKNSVLCKKNKNALQVILKPNIPKKKIDHHIQLIIDNISEVILLNKFDDYILHDLRKKIKNLYYFFSLRCLNYTHISTILKFKVDDLAAISGKLGEFHDLCFQIDELNPNKLISIPLDEITILQSIRKEWIVKKNMLKIRVILDLKQLLIKVI